MFGNDSGGTGGEPEVGEVGDAGDAGETGDGGEIGDGGERRGDGGVWVANASRSRLPLLSRGIKAAAGSGLFSTALMTSSSWAGGCFWAAMLTSLTSF